MDKAAAAKSAPLAGGPHRQEGDAAQGEVKIGRGADDRRVLPQARGMARAKR
jgi:hypothetical protein